jgi:hypothetical protein
MAKTYTIESVTMIQRGTNLVDDIYCHIKFAECSQPVPVYAHRLSETEFERDMWQRLEDEEFGAVTFPPSDYPRHPLTMIELDAAAREQREELLLKSDWTETASHLSAPQKADWKVYRQELRDVTNQPGYPWEVVWPTKPV